MVVCISSDEVLEIFGLFFAKEACVQLPLVHQDQQSSNSFPWSKRAHGVGLSGSARLF